MAGVWGDAGGPARDGGQVLTTEGHMEVLGRYMEAIKEEASKDAIE